MMKVNQKVWKEIIEAKEGIQKNSEFKFVDVDLDGIKMDKKQAQKVKEREKYLNEEGETVFELNFGVNPFEKIKPNIDIQPNQMNEEQMEIFESLNNPQLGYEDLEDDFFLDVENQDKQKFDEKLLDKETEHDHKDDITSDEFMKIIQQDAQNLQKQKACCIKDKNDTCIKETKNDQKELNNEDEFIKEKKDEPQEEQSMMNQAIEVLETKALNRNPRKGEVIVDQRVEQAKGGGIIIFRKVVKTKNNQKKQYFEGDDNQEKINLDDLEYDIEDYDDNEQVDIDDLEEQYQKNKNEIQDKDIKEDIQQDQIYFRRKKKNKPVYQPKEESEEEEEQIINGQVVLKKKKIRFNKDEDTKIQELLNENSEDDVQEKDQEDYPDIKLAKNLILKEKCQQAPEELVKQTNYYCMQVVEDEIEVKPVKLQNDVFNKNKKNKKEQQEQQVQINFDRKKDETKEEKKKRKQLQKEFKQQKKQQKREKKQQMAEERKQKIKQENAQKLKNNLVGISVHKI